MTDSIEAALAEIAAGRPVLVADDADRENEVDLVMAAQHADARWIGWAVRHGSGVICAPMTHTVADRLGLPPMVQDNQDPKGTAYTISVDATGLATGISAAERAKTLATLADPSSVVADFTRPGHIFPLRAREGGVLERTGHTEAAVDLARLAGCSPVGAIVELVHDDGSMMRLGDAEELAARDGLLVITIEDWWPGAGCTTGWCAGRARSCRRRTAHSRCSGTPTCSPVMITWHWCHPTGSPTNHRSSACIRSASPATHSARRGATAVHS